MLQMIFWKSNGNNMTTNATPSWSAPLNQTDINSINYPLSGWGKT